MNKIAVPYKFRVWDYENEKFLETEDGIYFRTTFRNYTLEQNVANLMNKDWCKVDQFIGYDSQENEVYTEDLLEKDGKKFLVDLQTDSNRINQAVKIGTFLDVGF